MIKILACDGCYYSTEVEAISMSQLYIGWCPPGTVFRVVNNIVVYK